MFKKILKALGLLFAVGFALLIILLLLPIRPTIDPIQPRDTTRYWTMAGDYRIAYTHLPAASPTENPPIIFLHGGPGGYIHSSLFDALGPLTDLGYDIYFYDQSGTGLSDRRERPKATTFDTHVSDLDEIITDHIARSPAVLIGQSYGGELIAHYAAENPERVAGLILSNPGGIHPPLFNADGQWKNTEMYPVPDNLNFINASPTYRQDTSIRRLPLRAIGAITSATLFDVKLIPDAEIDAALNTMAAGFTRNMVCHESNVPPEEGGGGAYSRAGANFFPDSFDDRRDEMAEMRAPVIVIQGQCDFIPYASTYEYVDRFPNARYYFLEGAGHTSWWDEPEAYRNIIAAFLIGLEENPN